MSKPWDNEPTPTTKQAVIDSHGHWTFELRDRMENLERRLRHAERLLTRAYQALPKFDGEIYAYLEAARQEDA